MIIHQAIYGYKRGHTLIASSLKNTEFLNSKLYPHTDNSPSLSGIYFDKYYAFLKIMTDTEASRSGTVCTHALIIEKRQIEIINNLEALFKYFINKTDIEQNDLDALNIEDNKLINFTVNQNIDISAAISSLINNAKTTVYAGNNEFEQLIVQLWGVFLPSMRNQFKFRFSSSPTDIDGKNYSIVNTKEEFAARWSSFPLIKFNEFVNPKSLSEYLLLHDPKANEFKNFITRLTIFPQSPNNLKQIEDCFNFYYKALVAKDAQLFDIAVGKIAQLVPEKEKANELKDEIFNEYLAKLSDSEINLIKSARNINFDAFSNGLEKVTEAIKIWLNANIEPETKIEIKDISVFLELAFIKENPTWWKNTIIEYIKKLFQKLNFHLVSFIYQIWNVNSKLIDSFQPFILDNSENEKLFVSEFKIENKESITAIRSFSKSNNWFILHAITLIKLYPPEKAIKEQLAFEKGTSGIDTLSKIIENKTFIEISLNNPDNRLHHIAGNLCANKPELLNELDLTIYNWQNIWVYALHHNNNFKSGVENPFNQLSILFDLLIEEKQVNTILLELFSKSEYANIFNYRRRANVWQYLGNNVKEEFLKATANHFIVVIEQQIEIKDFELELKQYILGTQFSNLVLSSNRYSCKKKILFLQKTNKLTELELNKVITNNITSISKDEALFIGNFINKKGWKNSAKLIRDIKWRNNNLQSAWNICKNQVGWFNDLFTFSRNKDYFNKYENDKIIKNPNNSNMPQIFISYNHKDQSIALKIKKKLEEASFDVIIDKEAMKAGEDIKQFIEKCISESGITISLVSTNSLLSAWVAMETNFSRYDEKIRGRYFIPCNIDNEFFKRDFTDLALDKIEDELKDINSKIVNRIEKDRQIKDLSTEKERFEELKHKLPAIIDELKGSLCIDLSDDKFDEGINKVIDDIKHFHNKSNSSEIINSDEHNELKNLIIDFRNETNKNFKEVLSGVNEIQVDLQTVYIQLINKIENQNLEVTEKIYQVFYELEKDSALAVSEIVFDCLDKLEDIEQDVKLIIPTLKKSDNWKTKIKFAVPLLTLFGVNISFEHEFKGNEIIKSVGKKLKTIIKKA
jgi:hypothetical protein